MAEQELLGTYSNKQIEDYLSLISFPNSKYGNFTAKTSSGKESLEYLSTLQQHHLAAVPFENLGLHYSPHRTLSIDKDDIYEKVVSTKRGRGGYCMEVNLFYATVLKSLGFELFAAGARVHIGGGPGEWSHQVTLVRIDGIIYMVDVGFGTQGPTHPLPLKDDIILQWGATDAQCRLVYQGAEIPFADGLWVYHHRTSPEKDWETIYSFGLLPFQPNDFRMMSYAVSTRKTSWFTHKIVVTKFVLDPKKKDVVGCLILFNNLLKRRTFDQVEVIAVLKNEEERVEALKKYFEIELTKREREAIRGTVTDLM